MASASTVVVVAVSVLVVVVVVLAEFVESDEGEDDGLFGFEDTELNARRRVKESWQEIGLIALLVARTCRTQRGM